MMASDADCYTDAEDEVLKKVYGLKEGCFLYLRDDFTSARKCFFEFIENAVKLAKSRNESNKMWMVENLAVQEEDNFDLDIKFREIHQENLLEEMLSCLDFNCVILAVAPTMDQDSASSLWLKTIHCKVNNLSPESSTFGPYETFSITGDTNILVWTNCYASTDDLRKLALSSDYQYLDDDITMQVYK